MSVPILVLAFVTLGYSMGFGGNFSSVPIGTSSPMVTADAFNPHFGALNSPSRRLGTRLPPETRLAWLEYLANVYIQCDDFINARDMISEIYYWLVEQPRLRKNISIAVQVLNRRIDERHECMMKRFGPNACESSNASPRPRRRSLWNKLTRRPRNQDFTEIAAENMGKIMTNVHYAAASTLNPLERKSLQHVYKLLKNGYVTAAMSEFQQMLAEQPMAGEKEAIRRFEFVLKLVKFDLENPDNCMPLWRTTCCVNWEMKRKILDTFEMLKSPASNLGHSVEDIFQRIDSLPMYQEIRERLLIAAGKVEAWMGLQSLRFQDRYLGKACLILRGVRKPEISAMPAIYGNQNHYHFQRVPFVDQLDARATAKNLYQHCIRSNRTTTRTSMRCQEGLEEIQGLEKSCPYGGFVRIGLFSQIFGDYLFIKCLSPPTVMPVQYTPMNLNFPSPVYRPAAPSFPHGHYRLVKRLSNLMQDFRDDLHDIGPVHRTNFDTINRYTPTLTPTPTFTPTPAPIHSYMTRPTENTMYLHHTMDDNMDDWMSQLRRYMRHLRRARRHQPINSFNNENHNNPEYNKTLGRLSGAFSNLADELEHHNDY